ncbi:MAG: TonB-dependent receptor [Bacillota bacterium]
MRMTLLLLLIFLYTATITYSQNQIKGFITDKHSKEALAGVNIKLPELRTGASSDERGYFEIKNLPDGPVQINISYIGYKDISLEIPLPLSNKDSLLTFNMEEESEELEEVTVSSSRTSRTIKDIPTRVEIIATEELDEKISMEPSNISMLLNESSGIYVQPTSATRGNSAISIQGLEGRYTQILKDGFPLFGGFSGSLSIMQIPPIDLKQVEVIKGSASTLYGADAIAGMINLISKEPGEKPELSLLYNVTTAGGMDASGFYSAKNDKLGLTISASRNTQRRYDADKDNFSDLPKIERYSAEPKLYYYFGDRSKISFGVSFLTEDRNGGDIYAIDNGGDSLRSYTEKNKSQRITTQFNLNAGLKEGDELTVKNSVSYFDRSLSLPSTKFSGINLSSYSEVSYMKNAGKHNIVVGSNLQTEVFKEDGSVYLNRDYSYYTFGGFIQDIWKVSDLLGLETGLRADYNSRQGTFILPRLSAIYNFSSSFSFRVGGGLGYKIPTIFLEKSEKAAYLNVLPLKNDIKAEKSAGLSLDINYKTLLFNQLTFSINQAFYYTRISSPVLANTDSLLRNLIYYENSKGSMSTSGFETNLKFTYDQFKLYTFYTYIYARQNNGILTSDLELTPRHKLGATLFFEEHENFRIGLEAYYTGRQRLSDGSFTKPYWIAGIMAEKQFAPFTFFLNFENMTDTRQSRFGNIIRGQRSNPFFSDIWAPLEGFIIN